MKTKKSMNSLDSSGISPEMAGEFISRPAPFRELMKGFQRLALKCGIHPDTGGDTDFAKEFFAALTEISKMSDSALSDALSEYFYNGLGAQIEALDQIEHLTKKCEDLEKQLEAGLGRYRLLEAKLAAKQAEEAKIAVNTIVSRQKRLMAKGRPKPVSVGEIKLSDLPNNVFLTPILIIDAEEEGRVNVSARICQIMSNRRLRHYEVYSNMSEELSSNEIRKQFEEGIDKSFLDEGFNEAKCDRVEGEVLGFINSNNIDETDQRILMASFDSLLPISSSTVDVNSFVKLSEENLEDEINFSPGSFDSSNIALLVISDDQNPEEPEKVNLVIATIYRFLTKEGKKQKTASPA